MKRKSLRGLLALLGCVLVVAGCGGGAGSGTRTLHVLGAWETSTDEGKTFVQILDAFTRKTGVKTQYEGNHDVNSVLQPRLQAGNPPDVASVPNPGSLTQLAKDGKLLPLDSAVDLGGMKSQYGQSWINLGSVNGKLYGVFIKVANKGLMFYNPKTAAAVNLNTSPKTYDDLLANTTAIKNAGKTPYCIGLSSGSASGWPATDWIKDFVLRSSGPQVYTDWYNGKVKFSDPQIKKGFQMFGQVVGQSYGGPDGVVSTEFNKGPAVTGLFDNPPKCYLEHQGAFMGGIFQTGNTGIQPVTDFDFFQFPTINSQYSGAEVVSGDLLGMFKDSSEAHQLMQFLTSQEAQEIWVKKTGSGAISANKQVPLTDYPDPVTKKAAQILVSSNINVFDAGDAMPSSLQSAFWAATLDYVKNPSGLDSILAKLDQTQADAYRS